MNYGWWIFYIVCAVLAYGLTFASFERKFAYITLDGHGGNYGIALFMGLLGPIGLLTAIFINTIHREWEYGILFKPIDFAEASRWVKKQESTETWVHWNHFRGCHDNCHMVWMPYCPKGGGHYPWADGLVSFSR